MLNHDLKDAIISRILPTVRTPAQYVGGELNSIVKDHGSVRGTVCLAFPDTYALGMSHHGLQVLYSLMNAHGWACERVFTPLPDFEAALRDHGLPLYSLETFTPLNQFDVMGFSLQYEICYTNVLTMLDLGGIALHAADRGPDDTLVIAGGPGGQNPELLAPFIDLFVIGDGEPSLPVVCDLWRDLKGSGLSRADKLARIAGSVAWAYVPRFYEPIYGERRHDRRDPPAARRRARGDPPVRDRRPGRDTAANPADRSLRRDRARPHRHRDHARLPLAVPLLPEHRDQAAAALSHRRDDRPGRTRELSEHRLRRDQPALALHQRLSPLRGAGDADERGLHAAGREDLAAQPADHRDAEEDPGAAPGGAEERPDAGPRGRARRHARADPQADQQRGPVRRLRRGVPARLAQGQALLHVRAARRAHGRSRRHRRDGRDDRPDRQGGHRPLRRGHGQRLQLRPQAAHALPVERHASRASISTGPTGTFGRGSSYGR